jgi:HAD superfamily phosphatase (TIGR01668 family)
MWLHPDLILTHITHLLLADLTRWQVKGLLMDLDNTLMPSHSGKVPPEIAAWLDTMHGHGIQMAVVSNNKNLVYTENAAKILNLPVVAHAQKPRRAGFHQALRILQLAPTQVAVIGDRPLTDIWGGMRLGAKTVLVRSLSAETEPRIFTLCRAIERLSLKPATPRYDL